MQEDQTRRCCCSLSSKRRRSELELRIPSRCRRRGVFGLTVCPSVCLSVVCITHHHICLVPWQTHHIWITSIMGVEGGLESFLSFFLWELLCQKAMWKYLSTLVRLYQHICRWRSSPLVHSCCSHLATQWLTNRYVVLRSATAVVVFRVVVGLAYYQGKDIVFGFMIEYSSPLAYEEKLGDLWEYPIT